MKTGTLISGAAHAALIAAAVFGLPWLSPDDASPVVVASVSFVSEADFERARTSGRAGGAPEESPVVSAPVPVTEPELPLIEAPAPPAISVDGLEYGANPDAPLQSPTGEFAAVVPRLTSPEPPAPVSAPRRRPADDTVALATPDIPEQEPAVPDIPPPDPAPEPERQPEPEPEVPDILPPEIAPEPGRQPDLSLSQSSRPKARRDDVVRAVPEPVVVPEVAVPDVPEPPSATPLKSLIADLVAEATPDTAPTVTEPTEPQGTGFSDGPPMSAGEKDGFRLAVQSCWNVPAGLRDAQELRVVLGAELSSTGDVIAGSIRLIEPDPVPDARFQRAFESGRRALLRCAPYSGLPGDKYAHWRRIEVVFDPEGMVSW